MANSNFLSIYSHYEIGNHEHADQFSAYCKCGLGKKEERGTFAGVPLLNQPVRSVFFIDFSISLLNFSMPLASDLKEGCLKWSTATVCVEGLLCMVFS